MGRAGAGGGGDPRRRLPISPSPFFFGWGGLARCVRLDRLSMPNLDCACIAALSGGRLHVIHYIILFGGCVCVCVGILCVLFHKVLPDTVRRMHAAGLRIRDRDKMAWEKRADAKVIQMAAA